jgi:hypothetical protein
MALQKQSIPINFAQGLDQKSDPWQVQPGRFLQLENSVFTKAGLLTKRNGFGQLTALPNTNALYATTFNGNLTAIGTQLEAYSDSTGYWINKGSLLPVSLSTLPLFRSNTDQSQADSAVANGLVCTVFTDNIPTGTPGATTPVYKYTVADSTTGQNVIPPTIVSASVGSMRVFNLGRYFIIIFSESASLWYIAVNNVTLAVSAASEISAQYTPASTVDFNAYSLNNNLYVFWNSNTGSVRAVEITSSLLLANAHEYTGQPATLMSVTADNSGAAPIIYATYYNGTAIYTLATDQNLNQVLAPTLAVTATVVNLATTAQNSAVTIMYEVHNTYAYDTSIPTNYVNVVAVSQTGTVTFPATDTQPTPVAPATVERSVGLASSAFLVNNGSTSNIYASLSAFPAPTTNNLGSFALNSSTGILYVSTGTAWVSNQVMYALFLYESPYQPTYFLISSVGNVVAKLAYSNAISSTATGVAYYPLGLPGVTINGTTAQIAYFYKDLIAAVNKNTNVAAGTQTAGIYSQTGINLVTFDVGQAALVSSELGQDLNISGGFLWMYDGYSPVEQNFFLWPDSVEVVDATGGGVATQLYYYQVTYEWTDNQGNAFRSAPSIPVSITPMGSAVTINVPTLRLTYKTANPVKIVIYRWSVAQQIYYQVTSISAPLYNDKTVDYVTYLDISSDSTILGNSILYTTGGVVEDIGPPSTSILANFDTRLWLVDAEDTNLLWYSKQVIENVPVEMSDLFTIYVSPTISAQGNTGPMTALSPMDDKLIIFKKDALYYINGTGPDNTGANSQYSQPTFITSTVGSVNPASIVLQPSGLMFQSDKGIWLLGRDLSTNYIGAPVENLTTGATVLSALAIPGTNQVRFTLDSGITLMYDYYFAQWGSFYGIPGISSTLYQSLHTYINASGAVFQETPGLYLDASNPVLMQFTTGWLDITGLQGLQRAYFFYILGQYITPHKLNISIAYDYNPAPTQVTLLTPDNYNKPWGGDALWGSGDTWGGTSTVENWRVFLQQQKCRSFQIAIQELYDPSLGVPAGAGLTLSGLNLVIGSKKGFATLRPSRSVG